MRIIRQAAALSLVLLIKSTSPAQAKSSSPLILVKDGKAEATIVIPAEPPLVEEQRRLKDWTTQDAALLLQDYIKRSTGVELPIVKENENPPEKNVVLVGPVKRAEKELGIHPRELPGEGYVIRSFNDGVAIVGEISKDGLDRGTLFGVYEFLERVVGVRWYFPGEIGTVVPEHGKLEVPAGMDVSGHPDFELRIGGVGYWVPDLAKQWHPVLRFGSRAGMVASHTVESWAELYGKSHPEYFGVREDGTRAIVTEATHSGQNRSFLCYSEPGVLEQHLQNIDDYFESGDVTSWTRAASQPEGNMIPLSAHDVREVCQCERCRAEQDPDRRRYGFSSNLFHKFAAKLAKELKKRHPEAVLWIMAYDHHQLPPTRVKFPDNVAVTLCLLPSMQQMTDASVRKRNYEIIDKWSDLVGNRRDRMVIFDYFLYPNAWFIAPTEMPDIMSDYARYTKGKALGWMNNGFNFSRERPHLYLSYRMVWLMHRLLWDTDADVDALREEWCRDLFGPAAETMDAFYQKLEDRWQNTQWSRSTVGGHNVPNDLIYGETYPKETVAELKALLDKAGTEIPEGGIYAKRYAWFREKAFDPFIAAANEYHALSERRPEQQVVKAIEAVTVDGQLTENVWGKAEPLVMSNSQDAGEVKNPGAVRVAYDAENLYVAVDFTAAEESGVKAEAKENNTEAVYLDDKVVIHLWPQDSKDFFELVVNADGIWNSEGGLLPHFGFFGEFPVKWDAEGIDAQGKKSDKGWTAEIVIPWKSLPGVTEVPANMRLQILRWDHTTAYQYESWSPMLDQWNYVKSRFGNLEFGEISLDER